MAKTSFRACERRAVHLPARLSGLQPDSIEVMLVNLSLSGGCVRSESQLTPGARLVLELQPPNLWDPLLLSSTIVWCQQRERTFFAGLQFELESAHVTGLLVDLMAAGSF